MLLGIDLGTGSVKAGLVDADGRVVRMASAGYRVETPNPSWAEIDPWCWWEAVVTAVAQVASGVRVQAIGLAGQMHGLVAVDQAGAPQRPAMLWPDRRAVPQLPAYRRLGIEGLLALANPITPGMTGPMLLWLRDNEPAVFASTRWALQPKDWLRMRLTGRPGADPSDASATLLFDLAADRWAVESLELLGLDPRMLATIHPSSGVAGVLLPLPAAELGLAAGTAVATGGADTAVAMAGAGLVAPGPVMLNVGSGAQVITQVAAPDPDPTGRTHRYRTVQQTGWYAMAAIQNAGISLERVLGWFEIGWEEAYRLAASAPPGSGGVDFWPHLSGERTDPSRRGGWTGLDLDTDRSRLVRAAFEGVVMAIRSGMAAVDGGGPRSLPVWLAGGAGVYPWWTQLLADGLGRPIAVVETAAASTRGAGFLAGCGSGVFADIEAAAGLVEPPVLVAEPGGDADIFAELYHRRQTGA